MTDLPSFEVDKTRLVCLEHELDLTHADAFNERLNDLFAHEGETLEVDLRACDYISSIFLGMLVSAAGRARSEKRNMHISVSPRLKRFLDTGNLNQFLHYTTPEEA